MIGFSIMMWFAAVILCIAAVSLLKGNTSLMHGRVYETTGDRMGYGKALGKLTLFLSFGIFCAGAAALFGTADTGIQNTFIIIILIVIPVIISFIKIQKKYGNH